jgi:branched-chain amino acid transport system substrate-binding protein
MLKRYILSLALVVAFLLAACCIPLPFECTDAIGCVDIAPGEPIEIGVIQALSGDATSFGIEQSRCIELALAARDNQLLGHPIKLQIEDELCSPEGGTNAALKIVTRPQTVAIIGTTCSGAAMTAAKTMSEAGRVMISGTNRAPSLTSIGTRQGADWQPGYFRTVYNGAEQGTIAARFVFQQLGVTKAATINDGDIYTQGLTDAFEQAFTELGGDIVLATAVNKGDTDMHPVLTAVARSGAEAIFFPIFQTEREFIVRQAREVTGLENVILVSDDILSSTFIEGVGTDGVGMYFVTSISPEGPAIDGLVSEYMSKYDELPHSPYYSHAYDAANLLLNAIDVVVVQDGDGTLHIGRQALRDALYATTDFQGVAGTLTCDQFGDCASARFNVVRLDDPTAGIEGLMSNVIYTYEPER